MTRLLDFKANIPTRMANPITIASIQIMMITKPAETVPLKTTKMTLAMQIAAIIKLRMTQDGGFQVSDSSDALWLR